MIQKIGLIVVGLSFVGLGAMIGMFVVLGVISTASGYDEEDRLTE